jgi:hypothetical protein
MIVLEVVLLVPEANAQRTPVRRPDRVPGNIFLDTSALPRYRI